MFTRTVALFLIFNLIGFVDVARIAYAEDGATPVESSEPEPEQSSNQASEAESDASPTETNNVPDADEGDTEEHITEADTTDSSDANADIGNDTGVHEADTEPESSIETGDATADGAVLNEVNMNIVDTDSGIGDGDDNAPNMSIEGDGTNFVISDGVDTTLEDGGVSSGGDSEGEEPAAEESISEQQPTDTVSTSSEEIAVSGESGGDSEGEEPTAEESVSEQQPADTATTTSQDISLENYGELGTTMIVDAETGQNEIILGTSSDITTGDAFAFADILNILNVNILNSSGVLLLLSKLLSTGDFDLRIFDLPTGQSQEDASDESGTSSDPCLFDECTGTDYSIITNNTASISNTVLVRADTGGNTIQGDDGSITTGNAYAAANIINIANTNIIDSNYILLALNNLGALNGDIILPGPSYFDWFMKGASNIAGGLSSSVDNSAAVHNAVSTIADTGENSVAGTGDTTEIVTGTAVSDSSITNIINTNLLGGQSLFMLLNVQGNWSGDVFGLPPGLSWMRTPTGIAIYSDSAKDAALLGGTSKLTNSASITNDVQVLALTGDNHIEGDGGSIDTGDAFAATNIFNLVNTNIVGQNWLLAALNIMGDWHGNLSFGRPDLWVGSRAESVDNPLRPNSSLKFYVTVTNFGDSIATDVTLRNIFDGTIVAFPDHGVEWSVGTLSPGETKVIEMPAMIQPGINVGSTPFEVSTSVTSRETDENYDDNTETLTLVAHNIVRVAGPKDTYLRSHPRLEVRKKSHVDSIVAPGSIDYTIDVYNNGSSAYNAELVDTLTDEHGVVITTQRWPLDEIFAGEHITITYTVEFNDDTHPGVYTNEARVFAANSPLVKGDKRLNDGDSNIARHMVTVVGDESTEELVAQTQHAAACDAYLTAYMRRGDNNDSVEVKKLQMFLRDFEGFTMLSVSGDFDESTEDAVRAFQDRYAEEILIPWGTPRNTGYVYFTTRQVINKQYCKNAITFSLSEDQLSEMKTFKEYYVDRYQRLLAETEIGTANNHQPRNTGDGTPWKGWESLMGNAKSIPNLGRMFTRSVSESLPETQAAGVIVGMHAWESWIHGAFQTLTRKATWLVNMFNPLARR